VPAVRQKLHLSPCPNFRSRLWQRYKDLARARAARRQEPTVIAECVFVDPVADIAVLGGAAHALDQKNSTPEPLSSRNAPVVRRRLLPRRASASEDRPCSVVWLPTVSSPRARHSTALHAVIMAVVSSPFWRTSVSHFQPRTPTVRPDRMLSSARR
jgi:hypothetical protein